MSESIEPHALPSGFWVQHLSHKPPRGAASGVDNTQANIPSFEQFLLEKGEKKVEMKLDTRRFLVLTLRLQYLIDFRQECPTPRSSHSTKKTILWATFYVLDYSKIVESHLPLTRCVAFCGSTGSTASSKKQVPHPLFPKFELRVQTDGSLTPKEALLTACRDSVSDLNTLSREFTKEYELRKMVNEGRENGI